MIIKIDSNLAKLWNAGTFLRILFIVFDMINCNLKQKSDLYQMFKEGIGIDPLHILAQEFHNNYINRLYSKKNTAQKQTQFF